MPTIRIIVQPKMRTGRASCGAATRMTPVITATRRMGNDASGSVGLVSSGSTVGNTSVNQRLSRMATTNERTAATDMSRNRSQRFLTMAEMNRPITIRIILRK